jgi:CHAT domain-containing protein
VTALSESEQTDFLRHYDGGKWQRALSLGLRHANDQQLAERSAVWLLNGKGVVQETLAQAALLARDSRDPRLRGLAQRLLETRQELARLTLAPPTNDQTGARQRRLDELNNLEQDLAKQLRNNGGNARDASWTDMPVLRAALPADAVMIDLARVTVYDFKDTSEQKCWQPARYAAWIIPAKGPVRLVDLGAADAIDADVQKVRQALQDASKKIRLEGEDKAGKAMREPLEVLAKKVLHPLLPYVGKSQRWILSPDGDLWLTPWAALPLPDGKYAVEDYTISYAISGRELVDSPSAKVTLTAPLVLADPDFDLGLDQVARATRRLLREQEAPAESRGLSQALRLGGIKRLPATAAEAAAITAKLRQYAGAAPRVLTDKEATVGVFQAARNPKVVVLSTHGYFLPDQEIDPQERDRLGPEAGKPRGLRLENPLLRCGLLLAGCNNADKAKEGGDNGVLTGLQIVGTDLRGCDLVVLSACDTGLGQVRNGEDVAGLRQAFQLAGAKAVVATLWQVPDQATAAAHDRLLRAASPPSRPRRRPCAQRS